MTYDVNVTVTKCYTVTVQAGSEEEAIEKATDEISMEGDC